jgi:hypothetical protein
MESTAVNLIAVHKTYEGVDYRNVATDMEHFQG